MFLSITLAFVIMLGFLFLLLLLQSILCLWIFDMILIISFWKLSLAQIKYWCNHINYSWNIKIYFYAYWKKYISSFAEQLCQDLNNMKLHDYKIKWSLRSWLANVKSVCLSSYMDSQKTKKEKNNFLYTKHHRLLKIQNKSLMRAPIPEWKFTTGLVLRTGIVLA